MESEVGCGVPQYRDALEPSWGDKKRIHGETRMTAFLDN
jgi:hypothetical protein